MRIIAGNLKAKKIIGPKTDKTRPTLDRVKEALFSILTNSICDAEILDLFSGTGNLAIESLSRGAKFAWLNDNQNICISTILNNIKLTNTQNCVKITKKDYTKCLNQILNEGYSFDIVFLDPPYDSNLGLDSLRIISSSKDKILKKDGIIVYETDKAFIKKIQMKNSNILDEFENLECFDTRQYGTVVLKLYRWRG